MTGKWLFWMRRLHMLLGVFFAPMLLLFILTGCWQTLASDEEKEREGGWLQTLVQHLSTVHTDSYFPPEHKGQISHLGFKILVVGMCAGLLISILLGIALAIKLVKGKWMVAAALVLGVVVPVMLLWLG